MAFNLGSAGIILAVASLVALVFVKKFEIDGELEFGHGKHQYEIEAEFEFEREGKKKRRKGKGKKKQASNDVKKQQLQNEMMLGEDVGEFLVPPQMNTYPF